MKTKRVRVQKLNLIVFFADKMTHRLITMLLATKLPNSKVVALDRNVINHLYLEWQNRLVDYITAEKHKLGNTLLHLHLVGSDIPTELAAILPELCNEMDVYDCQSEMTSAVWEQTPGVKLHTARNRVVYLNNFIGPFRDERLSVIADMLCKYDDLTFSDGDRDSIFSYVLGFLHYWRHEEDVGARNRKILNIPESTRQGDHLIRLFKVSQQQRPREHRVIKYRENMAINVHLVTESILPPLIHYYMLTSWFVQDEVNIVFFLRTKSGSVSTQVTGVCDSNFVNLPGMFAFLSGTPKLAVGYISHEDAITLIEKTTVVN